MVWQHALPIMQTYCYIYIEDINVLNFNVCLQCYGDQQENHHSNNISSSF